MKPLRALLVGCGGISRAWVNACRSHLSHRVTLVGFVDINPKAAADAATEIDGAWSGTSLDEALSKLQPDIVFNCTIPDAHHAVCTNALRAGCHVLTEKPLASTLAEAADLARLAAKLERTLAVIQNRRYNHGACRVRSAITTGLIGQPHTLNADFFLAPHFGGFREKMRHVLLLDMAIHTFDSSRFLGGVDPRAVYAFENNPPGSWYAHGASAAAIFEMSNGAIFNYRGSWCANGCPTAWQAAWRIIGNRGTIIWDGKDSIEIEAVDPSTDKSEHRPPIIPLTPPELPWSAADEGHAGNIRDFLDAIENRTAPPTAATDNLHSLAMVEFGVQSAERANRLEIPTDLLSFS